MLMFGPARPELPPHVKEGRNEAVGRPNQRSTPRRNPRSQPGARRREERGRPPEPGFITNFKGLGTTEEVYKLVE